ncbi:uncharacterized protein LOC124286844 [Haliotis rubra]|uniref:uncharacterized protein LOC124286844 n=1 Tax=Haliotis rubra TaxID=36100 RepID=UPI001EE585B7|nr:uncharacterized protein LOC124286844 [Haliotis rubra]XP_046579243.1 uncharacterized protein LOC124286844 [Haliotis rubra]
MLLCSYCGEDLPPGTQCGEGEEAYHVECITLNIPRGKEALKTYRDISTQSNVLCMAIHVNYIHGLAQENREQTKRKKEKRAIKARELLKNATALRNSNSGHLLIHFVGREKEDTFTGAFDEFADDKLQTLIQDGSLFTDVYSKRLLSDYATDLDKLQKKQQEVLQEISGKLEAKTKEQLRAQEQLEKLRLKAKETLDEQLLDAILQQRQKVVDTVKEIESLQNIKLKEEKKLSVCIDKATLKDTRHYTDFLVLYVEGGVYLTTSDSKTKIALDERIINPSDQTLIRFLKSKPQFRSVHPNANTLRGLTKLHESRSVQFKGYFKGKDTDEKTVHYMLDDHRLLEYISAFSKLPDGGTYFFGIAEKETSINGSPYKSKFMEIQQVPVGIQQNVEAKIKEGVSKGVLICDYDGHEIHNDIVNVFFIPSSRDNEQPDVTVKTPEQFVIQVHVQPVSGIVFYDKQGPLAYRVEADTVKPYSVKQWFHAVLVNSVVK